MTIVGQKDDPRAQALHALARDLPARYKRLEWLDLREGKLPNPDVEYPDLGEPARSRAATGSARFRRSTPKS